MKKNTKLLILLIIIEIISMFIIEYSVKNNTNHFVLSIPLYGFISYLFYILLKSKNESAASLNAIWNCSTTIIVTIVGIFFFKNKISKNHIIGIALSILSILFIESIIEL
tara:strand:- start:1781 stop:2110 length:330 start_codon:yes stop_codon:yes gene_type:complete